MPHALPVAPAPITDQLLEALIGLFENDRDKPLTPAEASLFHATPGCLRELLRYRQLLGRDYGRLWSEAIDAAPNVVRLPANDPHPEGVA